MITTKFTETPGTERNQLQASNLIDLNHDINISMSPTPINNSSIFQMKIQVYTEVALFLNTHLANYAMHIPCVTLWAK